MTSDDRYGWRGNERVVPVYAFTKGRTRPVTGEDLPLEALVTATGRPGKPGVALQAEDRAIIRLCARPTSVVEVGAALAVPVGVARVLVADLAAAGHLEVHLPEPGPDGLPPDAVLGRLLDGLRAR